MALASSAVAARATAGSASTPAHRATILKIRVLTMRASIAKGAEARRLSLRRLTKAERSQGMIRIGISGWIYPSWRGVFYPKGLPQRRELDYASRAFASIEVNGTFYALKPPGSFRRWRAETPPDFVFALKGGRFITHMKRLRDVETALANFFASGVLALGPKLGPILWQLPENFAFDAERIARF